MSEICIHSLVPFLATMEAVVPPSNILSRLADQYIGRLDTLNVKIWPLLMKWAAVFGFEKCYRWRTDRRR